jgi:hypothetical protein
MRCCNAVAVNNQGLTFLPLRIRFCKILECFVGVKPNIQKSERHACEAGDADTLMRHCADVRTSVRHPGTDGKPEGLRGHSELTSTRTSTHN